MLLLQVVRAFEDHSVDYAVVGGYAVALHGAVRGTVDLDIVISYTLFNFIHCETALRSLGLTPKLPVTAEEVFTNRERYIRERNLTAWCFINREDPTEIVDVILTHDVSKMNPVSIPVQGMSIRVASLDDLIAMKGLANRKQDIEDIAALKKLKR